MRTDKSDSSRSYSTPRRNDVKSWRIEAIEILQFIKYSGLVYVPEPFNGNYVEQIEWETKGLHASHRIVAWVCRDMTILEDRPIMPALTSNVEFGEWYNDPKFLYGRPIGTPHCDYLDYKYMNRPHGDVKPFNSLMSILQTATEGHCNV